MNNKNMEKETNARKIITISSDIPDIYYKCKEKFGVDWDKGVIFTYGPMIYCKYELSLAKMVHENVHVYQQGEDPKAWWEKYFEDVSFRLNQEVEAYRAEAKFVKSNIKDRNKAARLINQMAVDLSSSMYGNICTMNEARNLIKQ